MIKPRNQIKGILAKVRVDLQNDVIPCMDANNITGGYFSVPIIIFSLDSLVIVLLLFWFFLNIMYIFLSTIFAKSNKAKFISCL